MSSHSNNDDNSNYCKLKRKQGDNENGHRKMTKFFDSDFKDSEVYNEMRQEIENLKNQIVRLKNQKNADDNRLSDQNDIAGKKTNKEIGDEYESFVCTELNKLPSVQEAFLWKDVPEMVLCSAHCIHDYNRHRIARNQNNKDPLSPVNILRDVGIDIVVVNRDQTIDFVQCKNYSRNIRVEDLSGFFMMMSEHVDKKGFVYHPESGLSYHLTENVVSQRTKFVPLIMPQTHDEIQKVSPIQLFDYQKEIVEKYQSFFLSYQKSILALPCGVGKTIMSCFIVKEYKLVIFSTPLRQFAEQNLLRFNQYDSERKGILIDSDGTRSIQEIKDFIRKNDKVMLSVTYKSCDVVAAMLEFLNPLNPFFLFDEFHNLSASNIYGPPHEDEYFEDTQTAILEGKAIFDSIEIDQNHDDEIVDDSLFSDPIHSILSSNNKILCISATPRIYELEGEADVQIQDVLGPILHHMTLRTAIERNFVTDYNVYLPVFEDESKIELNQQIADISNELREPIENNEMSRKCCYLFECIKQLGTLKCIIYCRSHEEIQEFCQCFNFLNVYYGYHYIIDSLGYHDSKASRNLKIDRFEKSDSMAFLCAVKVLDECIDIPSCNSVYLTYDCSSKIKTVQRICRATRKDPKNEKKVAKILLWCDELSDILTFVSAVKEFDINFNTRIKWVGFNRGLRTLKEHEVEQLRCNSKYKQEIIAVTIYRGCDWMNHFNAVNEFIVRNGRKPRLCVEEEKKLAHWLNFNMRNFKRKDGLLKTTEIYDIFHEFLKRHSNLFLSHEQNWNNQFSSFAHFITQYKRLPTMAKTEQNNCEKVLALWFYRQRKKFQNKKLQERFPEAFQKYRELILKYPDIIYGGDRKEYLMKKWHTNADRLLEFVNTQKRYPSISVDSERQLSQWIEDQNSNYKQNVGLMKITELRLKWEEFIALKQRTPLIYRVSESTEKEWNDKFEQVSKFFESNHCRPSVKSDDATEKSLASWFLNQNHTFKEGTQIMALPKFQQKWEHLISSFPKAFETDLNDLWYKRYRDANEFIQNNHRLPHENSDDEFERTLYGWMLRQNRNMKHKNHLLKPNEQNQDKIEKWQQFYDEHFGKYLDTSWYKRYHELIDFVAKNNRIPRDDRTIQYESSLYAWMSKQNANFKNRSNSMSEKDRNKDKIEKWSEFQKSCFPTEN